MTFLDVNWTAFAAREAGHVFCLLAQGIGSSVAAQKISVATAWVSVVNFTTRLASDDLEPVPIFGFLFFFCSVWRKSVSRPLRPVLGQLWA